ncbi:RNA-binding S4 domain-containing protein [Vibrio lamellibrachiae]|uniref:RNA-binding S4 domain-containing protein n=1 Tax=Vibrio lamellibrachiae TaxID=2910253 RepID=UPI003D0C74DC
MNQDQHDQNPNYQEPDYDEASHEEEFEGEEIEIEAIGIDVSSQPIELYKVFKIANLVGGGGEAKHIISEGYVAVNGELETRKRRKMYDGDFFEFNQEYYVVVCDAPVTEPQDKKQKELEKKAAEEAKKKEKKKKKADKKKAEQSLNTDKKKSAKKNEPHTLNAKAEKPIESKDNNGGRGSIDFF